MIVSLKIVAIGAGLLVMIYILMKEIDSVKKVATDLISNGENSDYKEFIAMKRRAIHKEKMKNRKKPLSSPVVKHHYSYRRRG